MRTNAEEAATLGETLAGKVNAYRGPVAVMIPRRAISVISAAGQPFLDPVADAALFHAIREGLRNDIQIVEEDLEINDPMFAGQCAKRLMDLIRLAS